MEKVTHREALVKTIQRMEPWRLWVTLTFREPKSPHSAERHFRRFVRVICSDRREPVWSFYGIEWFQDGEAVHIHALIGYMTPCLVRPFWEWWHSHYGRALIEVYDPHKGAAWYVTKYILKEKTGLAWWNFFDWKPRKLFEKTVNQSILCLKRGTESGS